MRNEMWATVLIAIVGTVGTVAAGVIGYETGTKAVEKDYVQIAISTLDKKDSSPELRKWSVDVLSKLSPVPFGNKLEKELSQSGFHAGGFYMMRVKVPPELSQRCPNILAKNWASHEAVTDGKEVVDLMKQYDFCRVRLASVLELIDRLNQLADSTNRENGLLDQQGTRVPARAEQQANAS